MGVLDGNPVNQTVTNAAFINKNQDDVMSNKLGFNRLSSGSTISDIQQAVNNLYTATGVSESTSGTVYDAPSNTISDGDTYETALGLLADKFDPATGHMHTGAAGDAPPIAGSDISGVPLMGFIQQAPTLLSAAGTASDVTSDMSGKTPSNDSTTLGVVVNSPKNKVRLLIAGTGSDSYQQVQDGSGNLVYGRISASAATGGTWTLNYYSEQSGTETPYSFGSSTDLFWWYQELFNPLDSTSVYDPAMDLFAPASGGSGASGVSSIAASGGAQITGNVTFSEGSGIALTEAGQNIQIASNPTVPTITKYTSGSGTHNITGSPIYIKIKLQGPGAGGAGGNGVGGATIAGTAPSGNALFGTSLLTAGAGGTGSSSGANNTTGGAGGTNTINSPAVEILNCPGSQGGSGEYTVLSSAVSTGGIGGGTFSGQGGTGGTGSGSNGGNASTNSGAGGGGGGGNGTPSGQTAGQGGGGGGYLEAYILAANLDASYSYSLPSGGSGGAGSTSGNGGNGGNSYVIIEEYYQ